MTDLSLLHFPKLLATDGTKPDLNIGFQGLALIQGQIYNPVFAPAHEGLASRYFVFLYIHICLVIVYSYHSQTRIITLYMWPRFRFRESGGQKHEVQTSNGKMGQNLGVVQVMFWAQSFCDSHPYTENYHMRPMGWEYLPRHFCFNVAMFQLM